MLGQILIAGLFLLIAYYAYQRTFLFHGRVPPGPKGWPLIGILFEFDLPTLHLKLFDWTSKYGEIFQFELLGKKFVSLNSSAVIREAFIEEPNATATAARPPTFYGEYQLDNYADIAFASPNPLWTRRRKLAHQLIRSYGKGLSCIEFQIKRNLVVVKEQIRSHENKNIDPSDIVEEFILNTVEVLVRLIILIRYMPLSSLSCNRKKTHSQKLFFMFGCNRQLAEVLAKMESCKRFYTNWTTSSTSRPTPGMTRCMDSFHSYVIFLFLCLGI